MRAVSTIGLDIAKSVFQVHGIDEAGQVINADKRSAHGPKSECRAGDNATRIAKPGKRLRHHNARGLIADMGRLSRLMNFKSDVDCSNRD
jgi:AcrR family transcriptional regulator